MLNPFPELLSFALVSPLLLRLILAVTFIHFGRKNIKQNGLLKSFGMVEIIGGILLIIGMWVQIVAIIFSIYLIGLLYLKIRKGHFMSDGVNYYLLLLAIAVSLIFTGAGFISVDLPL
jgi:uncharacterized membrane protein YphA (DoxX/SURF4 family)